jgi:SAM-dependent methyltransferase
MDRDEVPRRELERSADFLRWINRRFGGVRSVLFHFNRWSRRWPAGRRVDVLDVAAGAADVPVALVRWGLRRGFDVRVAAVDRHPTMLEIAAEAIAAEPADVRDRIRLVGADVARLPFPPNAFDVAVASLFLHHLDDLRALGALKAMDDLAREAMIWSDLHRDPLSLAGARLMTLGAAPIIRHDAVVSVRAGFTRREALDFRDRLELFHLRFDRFLFHRFTLAGTR